MVCCAYVHWCFRMISCLERLASPIGRDNSSPSLLNPASEKFSPSREELILTTGQNDCYSNRSCCCGQTFWRKGICIIIPGSPNPFCFLVGFFFFSFGSCSCLCKLSLFPAASITCHHIGSEHSHKGGKSIVFIYFERNQLLTEHLYLNGLLVFRLLKVVHSERHHTG